MTTYNAGNIKIFIQLKDSIPYQLKKSSYGVYLYYNIVPNIFM